MLSLSPGPTPLDEVEHLRANAQMWRIEDDLWDNWKSVKAMYFRAEKWAPLVERGHWPDADMLPLGHIGIRAERGDDRLSLLSHDEQQTLMTFWSIFRSPLMFGGDLATLDAYTRSLLDQRGSHRRQSGQHRQQGRLQQRRSPRLDRSIGAREQDSTWLCSTLATRSPTFIWIGNKSGSTPLQAQSTTSGPASPLLRLLLSMSNLLRTPLLFTASR